MPHASFSCMDETYPFQSFLEMINDLINKGYAYENNKHVYFEVKKFSDYGKLSNKNLEELVAGSRVEISENKKMSNLFFFVWCAKSQYMIIQRVRNQFFVLKIFL